VGLSILAGVLISKDWNAIRSSDYIHIGDDPDEAFGVDKARSIEELETGENVYI
jgi:hypothetical protein